MFNKVGDGVGNHHCAPIRSKQQDAIAQRVEHLVQVRLQRGVSLFLAAHLAAEAIDSTADAANRIRPASQRVQHQRLVDQLVASRIAAGESQTLQLLADRSQRTQREGGEQRRTGHGGQRSQQRKFERRAQPGFVRSAQQRRPHSDMDDQEGPAVAIKRQRDVQHLGWTENFAHLIKNAAIAHTVETVAIVRTLIHSIRIGRNHGETVGVGHADVLHRRRILHNPVHR